MSLRLLIFAIAAVIAAVAMGSRGFAAEPAGRPGALKQLAQADEPKALASSWKAEIYDDPDSPTGGNPAGDVTIVEFFDYNCPYCRLAAPTLAEIERTDPNVKFSTRSSPSSGRVLNSRHGRPWPLTSRGDTSSSTRPSWPTTGASRRAQRWRPRKPSASMWNN